MLKMIKRTALLSILIFYVAQTYCQYNNPSDSMMFNAVVMLGVEKYLSKIPYGKEKEFGFNSREEFINIKLGNPYQIVIVNNLSDKSNSSDKFSFINRWKVPIMINDEYRCFLDVVRSDRYEAVGFGLHELAKDIDRYIKNGGLKYTKNKSLFIDNSLRLYCLVSQNSFTILKFHPFRNINYIEDYQEKKEYSSIEFFEIIEVGNKKQNCNEK